ncbi:hypothetical protein CQ010_08655 [Arthrobacter sp. MYb211]|uniref:plasmid pRiA4b ORF-3 family protein n=1 Tax=unclassified Arthrobacter TaxID=235627 RepID=UPI000CFD0900|nr:MULTISPECIES: plasmid pRiA4b ORF-3 family protein [unclassified Arthrobacter]PRA11580.1 hypothetical protein CQ015_09345 [Arthrobacter sp. MYb221]PRC07917.1 hypothetical protein CQ010_08655 [Arthrobacter sp. MYb211]
MSSYASVLQLKFRIRRTSPPIWRRVLVPGSMRLDQLHQVIQYSFGWYDAHPHQFELNGVNGVSFGPAGSEIRSDVDESTVCLDELLSHGQGKLDYVYDFGDYWEVRIELEGLPPVDAGPLPRCIGGRRMAPREDSGGPLGWAMVIEALKDPDHPDQAEYRKWLFLRDGEQFDASLFDKQRVNEMFEYAR